MLKEYQQHNGFELLRTFDLDVQIASKADLTGLLGMKSSLKIRRLLGRPSLSWLNGGSWCNEPHFEFWPGIHKINRPSYIHGYWQSELYFSDFANVIRTDFSFKADLDELDLPIFHKMSEAPCASLHVRRGDYLKGKFKNVYANCDISYYVSAVQLLRNKFPNIRLFAFSDEPEWIVKFLEPELGQIEIVSHNTGIRSSNDMRLMSLADHHIIANSSFSWWGAWLNPSKDKIVITPKDWFKDGRSTLNLLPLSWVKI
jgi:hypothetical protein